MVFDESTSALDFNTEDQILDCIKNLSKDITFILVSHRENTLKICDEVIYIDEINKVEFKILNFNDNTRINN